MINLDNNIDNNDFEIDYFGQPFFEGYSFYEVDKIVNDPFGPDSFVQLERLTPEEYEQIPLLQLAKYLLNLIKTNKEIKLTATGNLPVKIVKELYGAGFYKEANIESGLINLRIESDSLFISLTKILLLISPVVKKRKNILSLTKGGERIMEDDHELLKTLLLVMGKEFNWAFFDAYPDDMIMVGKIGFIYSLYLMGRYGDEVRPSTFYFKKYYTAMEGYFDDLQETESASRCYELRTFSRFLDYFGLIQIHKQQILPPLEVVKKPLFDRLFTIRKHSLFLEQKK